MLSSPIVRRFHALEIKVYRASLKWTKSILITLNYTTFRAEKQEEAENRAKKASGSIHWMNGPREDQAVLIKPR